MDELVELTAMDATLTDWADDDRVGAVVVAGAGERGDGRVDQDTAREIGDGHLAA